MLKLYNQKEEWDKEVESMVIGLLLGNSELELHGSGVRVRIIQCNSNVEYLMWFHKQLADKGYCQKSKPKLKRITHKKKVVYAYNFTSYTMHHSNWLTLYKRFYKEGKKRLPINCEHYITPLALAIWYLNRGYLFNKKMCGNCTPAHVEEDLVNLATILEKMFRIRTFIQYPNTLQIKHISINKLVSVIKSHTIPTMPDSFIISNNTLKLFKVNKAVES